MDDFYAGETAQLFSLAEAYQRKRDRDRHIENLMSPEELAHYRQKRALGGRLQVCEVLMLRYYRKRQPKNMTERVFQRECSNKLDNLLARHKYDIEYIINKWCEFSPAFTEYKDICSECGYRPPFCGYLWDGGCSYRLDKEDYAKI
jgi:hypothetical protein